VAGKRSDICEKAKRICGPSRRDDQRSYIFGRGNHERAEPSTIETFDILRLLKSLPHRYPFLMVDRVIEARGDEFGIGIKNVSINEPQFQGISRSVRHARRSPDRGHGPNRRGFMCERAFTRQKAAARLFHEHRQSQVSQPVTPGDRVEFHMTKTNRRRTMWWYQGRASSKACLSVSGNRSHAGRKRQVVLPLLFLRADCSRAQSLSKVFYSNTANQSVLCWNIASGINA